MSNSPKNGHLPIPGVGRLRFLWCKSLLHQYFWTKSTTSTTQRLLGTRHVGISCCWISSCRTRHMCHGFSWSHHGFQSIGDLQCWECRSVHFSVVARQSSDSTSQHTHIYIYTYDYIIYIYICIYQYIYIYDYIYMIIYI